LWAGVRTLGAVPESNLVRLEKVLTLNRAEVYRETTPKCPTIGRKRNA